MRRGEIWRTSLGELMDSGPGFRQPVLVVQSDDFTESAIRTTICAAVTSNLRLAQAPGNVHLTRKASGLPKDSVVNVSQLITLDKRTLTAQAGRVSSETLRKVDEGIRLALAI